MSRAAVNLPQPEPGGFKSLLLALFIHLLFFGFLMFAVNWRTERPEGMVVDLWSPAPPVAEPPRAEPRPEPPKPVEPAPEPPKPVEPPPKPVEPPQAAEPPKPDIELEKKKAEEEKRRKEAERKKEEERKKAEAEKRRLEEERKKAEAEQRRKEEERKKAEAEKRRVEQQKAAEAERARREQAKQLEELARLAREQEALASRLEAEAAAGRNQLVSDYTARIRAKITRYIVLPPEIAGNPEAQFDVVLLPSGEVLSAKLRKSSGNAAYDAAVERAILKAQPLPLPPDPAMFPQFRNMVLKFRPVE